MQIKQFFINCITAIFLVGCSSVERTHKPIVTVSIAPLAYLVERIADTTVQVQVLVPETTSPETYEPTTRQLKSLSQSDIYFAIGLIDFEQILATKITDLAPTTSYVNLSDGLELIEGECGHDHSASHNHNHAKDPHIWLSPRYMSRMATTITNLLSKQNPQNAARYQANLLALQADISTLDSTIQRRIDSCGVKAFAIVHPSLTYPAHDYGLEQIALEVDGKDPGAGQVKVLVDHLRNAKISKILYSRQTSNAAAKALADELKIGTVEYDPLAHDWLTNMNHLSDLLCN